MECGRWMGRDRCWVGVVGWWGVWTDVVVFCVLFYCFLTVSLVKFGIGVVWFGLVLLYGSVARPVHNCTVFGYTDT